MSFLRGSANYVWCTTSVLGKGATGAVFQGVNRHTGEPVAVKTFNQLSHMRPHEVQMREFEVLKKVNHENIVKLLAIEEEQEGRGKVIVMELCTGGSLFNILDDPENSHGLEEDEFILVLSHLAAGMKHLRDNSLVHRDLKPGNIMKFTDVDGSTIYKLTDFGAARELQDDQQFMSLYGTEEYLHPDMYERAVLRKPVGKTFGARVDLWSIGVTLYHVATGQLPFRPYGGRRNKETMYHITTEKAPGVISGVQTSENGPIDWCTELPETCQLSLGLRKLVTPLLAGLLEVDPQRMWNFERFFQEVTMILSKKVVHVFFVNKVQPLTVYMDPEHRYEELQYLICEQTDMNPDNQLLLYDKKHLSDIVAPDQPSSSYPSTTPRTPLVLFSKQDDDITLTLPETPAVKFGSFPTLVSVEHDAAVGKSMCSVGHAIKRKIDYFSKCVHLMDYSVLMFIEVIVNQLTTLQNRVGHVQSLTSAVSDRFGQLVANHRRFLMLTQMCGGNQESSSQPLRERLEDLVNNKVDAEKAATPTQESSPTQSPAQRLEEIVGAIVPEETVVRDSLNAMLPVVNQLYERVVRGGQLRRQWQQAGNNAVAVERAPNKASTYVTKLRESWQHLLRDRAARTLTFNDEQFHLLEKMKMKETAKSLETLLASVTATLHHTTDNLADWCKVAKVQRVQTEIEEADVEKHEVLVVSFQDTLGNTEDQYHQTLSGLLAAIKDKKLQDDPRLQSENPDTGAAKISSGTGNTNEPKETQKSKKESQNKARLKLSLREMCEAQEEVMRLLEENGTIIKRFQRITSQSDLSEEQ
ncbi:inhibitor of nuclear factor kappa-B kinase subunit epsilon-like isoform X2 [Penaeus japonicus]|nr:inhibitor of nuclear factor kappa-B kinase subunit epsilon-like isoform X1 [Penaeus japonicus]XP_042862365.1 inhibitor of nuclear factor kappa-B kinase subunit epsilon-like isoform X1 [Penaeus japonicus]XP_042862366.1 inhibitor of nuclear factor kappa-B kinase subunit epsilon-like isoform X1 [Penaeus japonicus]XP_042862367.1 inhibitor of nuclear factor kappa-B kinase subunit epsilon-like isoform X1 [Penaeus japonicus]XP_042862368.1 inhibitor of nuclear factor kappa-B kinase subunit epsilon-l